jgi:putative peptidoglycan lipid II flippase
VLAEPIVRLLFQHGSFQSSDTPAVAAVLACLAPGLIFFSMVNILGRAFYALGDIQTPMRISVFCLVLNVIFSLWLVQTWREAGLGIANSLTSMLNTALLLFALRKKLARLELRPLRQPLVATLAAAALSGQVAWLAASMWEQFLGYQTLLLRLGHVFGPMCLAGGVYFGLTLFLKVPAAQDLLGLARQKLGGQP